MPYTLVEIKNRLIGKLDGVEHPSKEAHINLVADEIHQYFTEIHDMDAPDSAFDFMSNILKANFQGGIKFDDNQAFVEDVGDVIDDSFLEAYSIEGGQPAYDEKMIALMTESPIASIQDSFSEWYGNENEKINAYDALRAAQAGGDPADPGEVEDNQLVP